MTKKNKRYIEKIRVIAEPDDILELAQELEPIVNQEVEKRIAERMPSEEEKEAAEIMQYLKAYGMIHPVTAVKYPEGTHEDFIKRSVKPTGINW